MEVGDDAPLVKVFEEAVRTTSPEAFVFSLAHVSKPIQLAAYRE